MMGELTSTITAANDDPRSAPSWSPAPGAGSAPAPTSRPCSTRTSRAERRQAPAAHRRGTDWVALCRQSKPLIAAINGASIGVGLTMVLPFDQIIAAKGAKLSCRFVKMGLVPELASSHFLTVRCGFGAASWLALSGATVLAEEAKELGLVDRVCEPDALSARRWRWPTSWPPTRRPSCA